MEEVRPLSVSAQMDLLELELRLPFCSFILLAGVAELADALDSKSSDRKIVWVRSPPPAFFAASRCLICEAVRHRQTNRVCAAHGL